MGFTVLLHRTKRETIIPHSILHRSRGAYRYRCKEKSTIMSYSLIPSIMCNVYSGERNMHQCTNAPRNPSPSGITYIQWRSRRILRKCLRLNACMHTSGWGNKYRGTGLLRSSHVENNESTVRYSTNHADRILHATLILPRWWIQDSGLHLSTHR